MLCETDIWNVCLVRLVAVVFCFEKGLKKAPKHGIRAVWVAR
jgi:hypothetical protein